MKKQMTNFGPLGKTPILVISIVTLLCAFVIAYAGPVTLDAPTLTPVTAASSISYDLANGDFNGDGKLDAATVQFASNTVNIVYGDGTGKFSAPVAFSTPAGPHALIAVDYNNDGKLDLLTANTTANTFSLFINDGLGNFSGNSYASGFAPTAVAVGDFNGDGRLDVATVSETANTVNYSLANAGGGFDTPSLISLPNAVPKFVVAPDLNGDGKADMVVANASAVTNNISVFISNGMGGFSSPTNYGTGSGNTSPSQISVGFFNADANLDLIVTLTGAGKISFFSGTGNGTFTLANTFTIGNQASVVTTTLIRDVNGDGKADLVSSCYGSDQLIVAYGDGAGGISTQLKIVTAKQPHTVALGDFNGDGLPDFNTVLDGSRQMAAFINRGPGDFPNPKQISTIQSLVRTADFNRDGKADLLLGTGGTNPSVLLGNGNGTFAAPVQVGGGGSNGTDLLVGDANGDNYPDVLTNNGGAVSIHLNNGSGGFPSLITVATPVSRIGLGDFNGDGKTDLVVIDPTTMTNNIRFYQGDGLGGFVLTSGATFAGTVLTLTVADLNSDNHPDLILTRGGGFGVMFWTAPYTYTTPVYYVNGCSPGPVASITGDTTSDFGPVSLADFNRDGKVDIARGSTACSLLIGNGAGSFTPLGTQSLFAPVVGDFDGNHIPDVALGPGDAGALSVLYHDGAGNFTSTTYATIRSSSPGVSADFNSDGVDDLVYTSSNSANPGAYLILSRPLARGLATADFDGDGKTDISVFRPANGTWYILRSSNNSFYSIQFGQNGDVPVPGDYDADGKTDAAVFRTNVWYILRSSDGAFVGVQHGSAGDIPVPADYNGDGTTNIAVFRPSTGFWYTSTNPATNYDAVQFGASGDIPAAADYDGDGRADITVFRPSTGYWYLLRSSQGFQQISFGINGDKPAPLDFDGDGKANLAVFRPSSATWYTSTNPATNFGAIQWGVPTDVIAPGYYDGDAKADVGVFRTGTWYVLNTATPTYSQYSFGAAGDIPIPMAYLPQ